MLAETLQDVIQAEMLGTLLLIPILLDGPRCPRGLCTSLQLLAKARPGHDTCQSILQH